MGAHLLFRLTSKGTKVRAVYRKVSDRGIVSHIFSYYTDEVQPLLDRIAWVEADLLDIPSVEEAMSDIKEVYHCAALVSFAPADENRLMDINPTTTANVVNVALEAGIRKLVYVSSVAALGRSSHQKEMSESSQWVESKHNSAYAKSKYLAELEVWRAIEEGLNAVIVNPSIILGPGKWKEGSAALFGTIGGGFKFYTEGVNAYVDVRDVVTIMEALMKSEISGQRFVLAAENMTYHQVFQEIAQALGVKEPSVEAQPWMGELVWRLEKLKTLFGGNPKVTRETARTARQMNRYDNARVKEALNYEFRPVGESIRDFAKFYRQDSGH